jgi:hypothetical protein
MRELTKSMMSYTWSISVFGVQQFVNLMTPSSDVCGKATQAFDNVTDATTDTFGSAMRQAFQAGDSLQRRLIDIMFGGLTVGGLDPNRWVGLAREAAQKVADATRGAAQGTTPGLTPPRAAGAGTPPGSNWGPMPH